MRQLLFILMLLPAANCDAQCGVYLTVEDYIQGKLTDECKFLKTKDYNKVVLQTAKGKKEYLWADIWGYKDGLSEYRILYETPMLIACKGALYVFTPYGPITKFGSNNVTYMRKGWGFGGIVLTKNIRDPEVWPITSYDDLWQYIEPKLINKVKEYAYKITDNNDDVMVIPEQLIDYYNSLCPGYVPPVYNNIRMSKY